MQVLRKFEQSSLFYCFWGHFTFLLFFSFANFFAEFLMLQSEYTQLDVTIVHPDAYFATKDKIEMMAIANCMSTVMQNKVKIESGFSLRVFLFSYVSQKCEHKHIFWLRENNRPMWREILKNARTNERRKMPQWGVEDILSLSMKSRNTGSILTWVFAAFIPLYNYTI